MVAPANADLAVLAPPGDPGDFVRLDDRPVFKEHVSRSGTPIDKRALERICQRCNERIMDTGDFVPVVLRHTSDDGSRDPEVVGFAGPFRMGVVGQLRPKHAILSTVWLFNADAERVKKYPRLSVEYWASESDPTDGYFDPISLLGAETPELDLGIRYSKDEASGRRLVRYSRVTRFEAAAPGGSNTFVAGGTNLGRKKDKSSHPQPFQKESFMPMSPEDLQQVVQALTPVVQQAVSEAMGGGMADPAELAGGGDLGGGLDDPSMTPYAKLCKYAATGDEAGAKKFLDGLDDTARASITSELEGDADEDRKMRLQKYMAGGSGTGKPDHYTKLRGERDEYRDRYEKEVKARRKAETELTDLRTRVEKIEASERRAVRFQKLSGLASEGYVFDPEEEIEDCLGQSDDQFAKHCERIVSRYQRVPLGTIPTGQPTKIDGTPEQKKREKYAKQAQDNCLAARDRGERLDYKTELERLVREDGKAAA